MCICSIKVWTIRCSSRTKGNTSRRNFIVSRKTRFNKTDFGEANMKKNNSFSISTLRQFFKKIKDLIIKK